MGSLCGWWVCGGAGVACRGVGRLVRCWARWLRCGCVVWMWIGVGCSRGWARGGWGCLRMRFSVSGIGLRRVGGAGDVAAVGQVPDGSSVVGGGGRDG